MSQYRVIVSCLIALANCLSAVSQAAQEANAPAETSKKEATIDAAWLSAFAFRNIGPAFMSGRIADIAIDQEHPNTWYVGVGSGGVWKTTNSGTTWSPIFDGQASYSIGCVTIDPSNCNTIWIGTGENVGGRHVGVGDGVYVSRDGGKSFQNKGLKATEHISKIVVDPRDSKTIWVAAQGPLWSNGGERGLYKSTDGGESWRQVLSKGPFTGVTDVVIDPTNPDVLYAATHQRHRTVWALLNTGPETGIYKSVDAGETWTQLTHGLPGEDKGKISLGVSPQQNNVVYATIELPNRAGGFWRSEDNGNSWSKVSDFVSGGTGPHYYQEIYLDPHRFDVVYHANNILMRSVDGGRTWNTIEGRWKHVDNHAVVFHPTDREFLLVGTDGGLYESHDFAVSFRFFSNLPVTQFYKVDVDYDLPFYNMIGGTQDNNTQYGPSRTRFVQGIRNADWIIAVGGDGHDNAIDPTNPDIIYGESQEGFIRRFDRKALESIDIQPQPGKGEESHRFNWDSPILISPHNPNRIYFGSRMLHRSDDRGDSWTAISSDLSRAQNRWTLPIMGRVWGIDAGFDLLAMSQYGNITSVSESPLVEGLIYVGTDDGLLWVTENGGAAWRKIERIYGVPEQAFVNDVKADKHDPNTVYAALDHHKTGDFKSYLVRSRDRGVTWESIVGDLPDRHLVWRLEQDHVASNLFFAGTEYGVFVTFDAGQHWMKMSAGMPTIPIRDLAIQKRESDLVGASFGRGFFVLDDYSPLREFGAAGFRDKDLAIFPVRITPWYLPADALGGEKGFQGDDYFTAPNPTYGAVFTVFLKAVAKTKQQLRREREQTARNENKDVEVPDATTLHEEADELAERWYLEISDLSGRFLHRIDLPASAGIHRVAWDMRYTLPGTTFGMLAAPGKYRVQGFKFANEQVAKIGEPVEFELASIVESAIPPQAANDVIAFRERAATLQVQLSEATSSLNRLAQEIEGRLALIASHGQDLDGMHSAARKIKLGHEKLQRDLSGDPLLASRNIRGVPSVADRLMLAVFGAAGSTYGPTKTHRQQLDIADQELTQLRAAIEQLENTQVAELRAKMKAANLNWFPPAPMMFGPGQE